MDMNRLYLFLCFAFYFINTSTASTYTCDSTASCGCSISSTSVTSRIIGGEAAQDNAWGWTAQLTKLGVYICSAVLISSEYALTAGHCVSGDTTASELSLIAGTNLLYDPNGTGQHRSIIDFYLHPNFNSTTDVNDIVVLHFLPLSDSNVKYICLPSANVDSFTVGSNVVVAGWGVTVVGDHIPATNLQQVTVQIFSSTSTDCQRAPITDSNIQLCAGVVGGGKGRINLSIKLDYFYLLMYFLDACQGDSGGPLMFFTNNVWVLAGLTSAGHGCAQAGYPGLYTRISAFVNFIENIINFHGIVAESTATTTTIQSSDQPADSSKTNNATNLDSFLYRLVSIFILCFISSIY